MPSSECSTVIESGSVQFSGIHVRMYSVFFKYFSGGGGQTNILRNRGGRRLQLTCIKVKCS